MFHEVEVSWSLSVTQKERDWPTRTTFNCQFWPQLRVINNHPVFVPFTLTFTISKTITISRPVLSLAMHAKIVFRNGKVHIHLMCI
ncbi:hypothetical protein KSP39_PZI019998 [Platanthera zijinensis]|uniref:Uncharacterized protein n=1 Tax=Platanthera zijinensis TaxID=2320716 RepID=A0AAP0AZM5_9ASPA